MAMQTFPLPALIADIGGTNARFAFVDRDGVLGGPLRFAIDDYPDIEEALASKVLPSLTEQPHSVAFAVAGAIDGDDVTLTNGHWRFSPPRLIAEFGFQQVTLFNDFEATALALPALSAADAEQIGGDAPVEGAPMLAIGPGTGLGVAAVLQVDGRFHPIATEGGHVEFGPDRATDVPLWEALWRAEGEPISPEMILSGSGVARLYHAVCTVRGDAQRLDGTPAIVEAGLARRDAAAEETLHRFAAALGRYAGDLALLFLARGGVFLAGGVSTHLGDALRGDAFRDAFRTSRQHQDILDAIPIHLVTHASPALKGLGELMSRPERYTINLDGRHWR